MLHNAPSNFFSNRSSGSSATNQETATNPAHVFAGLVSGSGRFVAFISNAADLDPGDTNGELDVFVHNLASGRTTRASVDAEGRQRSLCRRAHG
jgi:hypothetical protein